MELLLYVTLFACFFPSLNGRFVAYLLRPMLSKCTLFEAMPEFPIF